MNYPYFIAQRLVSSKAYKSSVSAPIIKIGTAAIAIGMVVMLIAVATGFGLQEKIRDKASAFNGHVVISKFNGNNSDESLNPIPIDSLAIDFYPEFKSVTGIAHIQAVASKFGIIRTETDFEGIIFKGIGADFNWSFFGQFLTQGRLPIYGDTINNEVLISAYQAERLGFAVGDKMFTYFLKDDLRKTPFIRAFEVVGLYNSGMEEMDKRYVLGDIKHVQRFNKWTPDQVGHFEVFLDDFNLIEEKGIEIYTQIDPKLDAKTIQQKYASIFEWIGIFDQNIYIIIAIMVVIAGFNMITALLVLILERTQMIGLLKALGSSDWAVRKIFLYNAIYLIFRGLLIGNILGLGLLNLEQHFKLIPLNAKVYHVSSVPISLHFWDILWLNLGTLLLCLAMLLLPSYIIAKISPVRAMRFE